MEKQVLVTAFDPFNGREENVSEQVLLALDPNVPHTKLTKVVLPTVYYEATDQLNKLIDETDYDVIIMLGEASNYQYITTEARAFNELNSKVADNKGQVFTGKKMYDDGEETYFATFSAAKIKEILDETKIINYVSFDAGRFLCNSLLYGAMYHQDKIDRFAATTFIHLPIFKTENEKNNAIDALNHLIYRLFND